jgi:hypothetical protein
LALLLAAASILTVDYVDGVIRFLQIVGTYLINSEVSSVTSHMTTI